MAARHIGNDILNYNENYKKLFAQLLIILSLIILVAVLILSVVLTYKLVLLNEDISDIGGFKILSPINFNKLTNQEDLVLLKKVPLNMIKIGDIICLSEESSTLTYKIKEIEKNKFITINSESGKEFVVRYEDVLGKYVLRIPKGQYILTLSKNPFFIFFIFLLFLMNISLLMSRYS